MNALDKLHHARSPMLRLLVGALLAEWLATGKGLGYKLLQSGALSDYSGLWSRVVLVTSTKGRAGNTRTTYDTQSM